MKKSRWLTQTALVGALALADLVPAAQAQPGEFDRPDPPRRLAGGRWWGERGQRRPLHGGQRGFAMRRFERRRLLMRELDLTAEQREKIAGIRERQAKKAIHARADIQVAAMDLRRLMRAERPDKVAIERQIDTIARMRADLHKSQVESMLEERSVLTPEQQKKLREMRTGEEG